jgi:nitrous oxide reductase
MKSESKAKLGRRDFLRALGASAGVAVATSAPLAGQAVADTETNDEKRKARYKADSASVRTYYRVNSYPSK